MKKAKLITLTDDNYYSQQAGIDYCSVSQLKQFLNGFKGEDACEERALAEIHGEYEPPKSDALLVGSLFDIAMLEPEKLEGFKAMHPEMYSSRGATKGELKAQFKIVDLMVDRANKDKLFMKSLEGEHQKIFTGEIYGVPFKAKLDVYKEGKYICDLKSCKSIRDSYYNPLTKRRESFIEYFDYITQATIYRELVYQNTGDKLPFFICAVSKETPVDLEIIEIDEDTMDRRLEELEEPIKQVQMLKAGEVKPTKCGVCPYCIERKVLTRPINWTELAGRLEDDEVEVKQ